MKKKPPHDAPMADAKPDSEALATFCTKIIAEGFVPLEVLTAEFGPEATSRAIAILYRTYRFLREARRPWKNGKESLGYEWADPRWSQAQIRKLPAWMGFVLPYLQKGQARYTDFVNIRIKCRWINAILGAVPTKDGEGELNVFERDSLGQVLILRYNQRAMAAKALPIIGKEAAIARRIGWSIIRLSAVTIKIHSSGIVQEGQGGKGIRRNEMIPDGTEFIIDAMVPTSTLSPSDFLLMLRKAGQYVGLSPARSAGFGDFEVVEVLAAE